MSRVWHLSLFVFLSLPAMVLFQNFIVSKDSFESKVTLSNGGPDLFMPGHDACELAQRNPPKIRNLILNVKDFGAIGDGKSRKLGSLAGKIPDVLLKSISELNTVLTPDRRVNYDDQVDWIAIQAALVNARANNGATVILPPSIGNYIINRRIWLYSNITLKWTGESYVAISGPVGGSVISSVNWYDRKAYPAFNDHLCNVVLVNPLVDAGGIGTQKVYGENGISFVNGSQGVLILGGHIKNSRWGTRANAAATGQMAQGGRALQFESGVKDIYVRGTRVSDSTLGISSAAGFEAFKNGTEKNKSGGTYSDFRPHVENYERPEEMIRNIAWNIDIKNVTIENTEKPFLFGNLLFGHVDSEGKSYYESVDNLKISVSEFEVRNSGLMTKESLEEGLSILDSGIFTFVGAKNVRIVQGVVNNSRYKKIGALVQGFGSNLVLSKIQFMGDSVATFSLGKKAGFKVYSRSKSNRIAVGGISLQGSSDYLLEGQNLTDISLGQMTLGKINKQMFHRDFISQLTPNQRNTIRMGYRFSAKDPYLFQFPFK